MNKTLLKMLNQKVMVLAKLNIDKPCSIYYTVSFL